MFSQSRNDKKALNVMIGLKKKTYWFIFLIFFLIYFVFFLLFNGYHLIYQEQTQLFLFDRYYFASFLIKPGGISSWLGVFLTQFYQSTFAAASIVTGTGILLFLLTASILRHYRMKGIVWPLIPVILAGALQCSQLYLMGTTAGLLISLSFFRLYIGIIDNRYRYLAGIVCCSLLWFVAGSFGLLVSALCIMHELLFTKVQYRFIISIIYLGMAFLIPFVSARLAYYIKGSEIWMPLLPLSLKKQLHPFIFVLFLYFPVLMAFSAFAGKIPENRYFTGWNWFTITSGLVILGSLSFYIYRNVYDVKTEIVLQIDNYVQKGKWQKALESAFNYPGTNQLVLYYGNMAMYKTGQMGDNMFHLPQSGIQGLWLEWKRNEITPFFGGELFYQLGYISEAYRWAFESMVAMGENPRSLKRLVITSLITGDTSLSRHYINILDKTLFYRKWAHSYRIMLNQPEILVRNSEIMEKKHFNMNTDVFADIKGKDIGLIQLLKDHPDNRMAFEYYMAQSLLNKDIDRFAAGLSKLRELGFLRLPVNYEEAILVYMSHSKKNIIPEGYSISRETVSRLSGYLKIMNNCGNDRRKAFQMLYPDYRGTYWFYLNFGKN